MNELGFFAGATALMAIIAQTGAMFYWGGKLQATVTSLKESSDKQDARLRRLEGLDIERGSW